LLRPINVVAIIAGTILIAGALIVLWSLLKGKSVCANETVLDSGIVPAGFTIREGDSLTKLRHATVFGQELFLLKIHFSAAKNKRHWLKMNVLVRLKPLHLNNFC
jgi:hypothetical protein